MWQLEVALCQTHGNKEVKWNQDDMIFQRERERDRQRDREDEEEEEERVAYESLSSFPH